MQSDKLTRLPLELLVRVESFCGVLDLLALRQTSKYLAKCSRDRAVWLNALRNVCRQLCLFLPSFPFEEMDVRQLEYAATAHLRFVSVARSSSKLSNTLEAFATRILKLPPYLKDFQSLSLIPGSRFLLTSTDNGIQLWDLGFSPEKVVNPKPLAMVPFKMAVTGECRMSMTCRPTADGEGLLVASRCTGVDCSTVTVYEFYPNRPDCELREIQSMEVGVRLGRWTLDPISRRILMLDRLLKEIWLWDFEEDSWCRWTIGKNKQMFLCRDNVFLTEDNFFSIYALPPLSTRVPKVLPELIAHEPLLRVDRTGELRHRRGLSSQKLWTFGHSSDDLRRFDLLGKNEHQGVVLLHKVVQPIPTPASSPPGTQMPGLLPLTAHKLIHAQVDLSVTGGYSMGYLPETQTRVLTWKSAGAIKLHVSSVAPSSASEYGEQRQVAGVLFSHEDVGPGQLVMESEKFSFGPDSGRLCLPVNKREIRVIDYVPLLEH